MPDSSIDSFPRQHARTQRFTCGVPRNVRVANDGSRILFLRSPKGDDPVNALWSMNPATGKERLIASPLTLLSGENSEGDHQRVPAAELARRERVRESGSGIVAYDGLADLSRVCFVLDGRVFLAEVPGPDEVSDPRVVELASSGDAYDPRLSPGGTAVAYVVIRG
jgi:dipeptidyl-peptidase-4